MERELKGLDLSVGVFNEKQFVSQNGIEFKI